MFFDRFRWFENILGLMRLKQRENSYTIYHLDSEGNKYVGSDWLSTRPISLFACISQSSPYGLLCEY